MIICASKLHKGVMGTRQTDRWISTGMILKGRIYECHSKGELITYTKVMGTALLFVQWSTLGLDIKDKSPNNSFVKGSLNLYLSPQKRRRELQSTVITFPRTPA